MARLGSRMTYSEAREELRLLWGLDVSCAAIRDATLSYGQAAQEVVEAEVQRLEREATAATAHPEQLVMSADGAFVQLTSGDWREVKTVAFGEFQTGWDPQRRAITVHTGQVSYFSRLEPAEQFGRSALYEWQRRGGANARRVVAVNDGAAWIQTFIDYHCPQATRVIDFAHAQSHVATIGRAIYGADTPEFQQWYARASRQLGRQPPQRILADLRFLQQQHPDHPEQQEIEQAIRYLATRRAMIDYPHFRQARIPIGSGIAESGHKVVMQRRMKQAGMRWAEASVNPILALRTILCNERWAEEWPAIYQQRRRCQRQRRRRRTRRPVPAPVTLDSVVVGAAASRPEPAPASPTKRDHPWRNNKWPLRYR